MAADAGFSKRTPSRRPLRGVGPPVVVTEGGIVTLDPTVARPEDSSYMRVGAALPQFG